VGSVASTVAEDLGTVDAAEGDGCGVVVVEVLGGVHGLAAAWAGCAWHEVGECCVAGCSVVPAVASLGGGEGHSSTTLCWQSHQLGLS